MTGIKDLSTDSLAALVRKHGLPLVADRCGIQRKSLGSRLNRAGYSYDGVPYQRPVAGAYRYDDWPPAVAGKGEQTRMQMYAARQAQAEAEYALNRARRAAA